MECGVNTALRKYEKWFGSRENTVFEKPCGFYLCETDDPGLGLMLISHQPVKVFHCTKIGSVATCGILRTNNFVPVPKKRQAYQKLKKN